MEFRPITADDLPKAKALWKQAFLDTEAYIEFNFKNNIDLNDSIGCFDGDYLAAMLFMLKKTLAFSATKKETPVFFIAGVATDLKYRHKGIATQMMNKAQEFLYNKGIPVVYLYPFNHQFYKKQGYHTISWMKKVTFKKKCSLSVENPITFMNYDKTLFPEAATLLRLYTAYAESKTAYFKRTIEDFELMMKTMAIDNGRYAVVFQDDEPMGYVLYYIIDRKFHCVEAVFLNQEVADATINAICKEYSGFIYVDDAFKIKKATTQEYAMMQIVNIDKAKKVFGKTSVADILGVETTILEQY